MFVCCLLGEVCVQYAFSIIENDILYNYPTFLRRVRFKHCHESPSTNNGDSRDPTKTTEAEARAARAENEAHEAKVKADLAEQVPVPDESERCRYWNVSLMTSRRTPMAWGSVWLDPKTYPIKHRTSGGMTGCLGCKKNKALWNWAIGYVPGWEKENLRKDI